jgi:PHP family Zn ribbon phosphoesterase
MGLRRYRADCHIHTCLSPCGELTMSPRAVVERALEAKLDIIAVTDHNATENASAAAEASAGTGLTVFPGFEVASEEEVHLLGLFEIGTDLAPLQAEIYAHLPDFAAGRKFIKDQVIVDAEDIVTGFNRHCLFGATRLSLRALVDLVHGHGGLALASHIDRESFSVVSQLGFVPPDLELDAAEITGRGDPAEVRARFALPPGLPLVRFSDAHRPEEIGQGTTELLLAAPSLAEMRLALAGRDGRRIERP